MYNPLWAQTNYNEFRIPFFKKDFYQNFYLKHFLSVFNDSVSTSVRKFFFQFFNASLSQMSFLLQHFIYFYFYILFSLFFYFWSKCLYLFTKFSCNLHSIDRLLAKWSKSKQTKTSYSFFFPLWILLWNEYLPIFFVKLNDRRYLEIFYFSISEIHLQINY